MRSRILHQIRRQKNSLLKRLNETTRQHVVQLHRKASSFVSESLLEKISDTEDSGEM
jgi:hypothetical protein